MSLSFFQSWQNELSTHPKLKVFWSGWAAGSVLLFIPLTIYVYFLPFGKTALVLCVVSVFFARAIVAEVVYFFFKKERPYQKYSLKPPEFFLFSFTNHRADSFPSGHVIGLSAIASVLTFFSLWLGLLAYGICLLTALARVITAYHYPSDVVAGFFFGSLCGLLTIFLYINSYLPDWLNLLK